MQWKKYTMDEEKLGVVSTTQLRLLLTRLLDNPQSNVCIRTRCLGEMWSPNFTRVLMLTDKGVLILNDEVLVKAVIIPFVRDIIQFENRSTLRRVRTAFSLYGTACITSPSA